MLQLQALLDADLGNANRRVNAKAPLVEERLPFTLRVVSNEADLWKAVQIRHAAYSRHVPDFAATLARPEATDFEDGVAVLLAESRLDGAPLGTMRIQTNRYKPLSLEQSLTLPDWLQGRPLAEATRLGITEERVGRVVKTALFKAYFQFCAEDGVDWMVIAGRSPIDRQYERLMFKDVYPGQGFIPLRHAGNMPHRVMALQVSQVEPTWRQASHPLYDYFFRTRHVDIDASPVMARDDGRVASPWEHDAVLATQ
ncbi:MAG TPA: hypothetical protein VIM12_11200 [Noviherbaspirillum sp.]|jgi:hypothetical protein|uniref:hypothetical protein n=1 Tax=Noviherbaspirillum sp. TaxID=1926288 RepID=UPI002F938DC8